MQPLILDIETRPNIAAIWEMWNVKYVPPTALIEAKEVICFAAKWHGTKAMEFWSVREDGKTDMVAAAHDLLNFADVVVHYNGRTFDIPHLNREMLLLDYMPPSPYKQVDLIDVVKKQFNFPYNSLDYVSQELGLGKKAPNEGMDLWMKCMNGDQAAWDTMKAYNMQDVVLTEKLYDKLRPWISGHPSIGAELGLDVCSRCGGSFLVKEGFSYTKVGRYQRYSCTTCGAWLTATRRDQGTHIKEET